MHVKYFLLFKSLSLSFLFYQKTIEHTKHNTKYNNSPFSRMNPCNISTILRIQCTFKIFCTGFVCLYVFQCISSPNLCLYCQRVHNNNALALTLSAFVWIHSLHYFLPAFFTLLSLPRRILAIDNRHTNTKKESLHLSKLHSPVNNNI